MDVGVLSVAVNRQTSSWSIVELLHIRLCILLHSLELRKTYWNYWLLRKIALARFEAVVGLQVVDITVLSLN